MRIIFCGTSEFAVPILKKIKTKTNWDIALVVSEPAKPAGRQNLLSDSPMAQTAKELKLKLVTPKSIKDITSDIADIKPDIAIVVAYGQILPEDIIKIPKFKTVNIHPSLLPKLRGPSPIQTALAQGLTETGVSLMLIDKKIDHGPVILQESFLIGENENYLTLEYQLAQIGAAMLIRDLPKYILGKIKPQEQNHSEATFTKLIKKGDGQIDWQKMMAEEIYNLWRAYIKWPGIHTFFKDRSGKSVRLKLIEIQPATSEVASAKAGQIFTDGLKNLYFGCRTGAIKLIRLQPENSKILSDEEFLNGYRYLIKV